MVRKSKTKLQISHNNNNLRNHCINTVYLTRHQNHSYII